MLRARTHTLASVSFTFSPCRPVKRKKYTNTHANTHTRTHSHTRKHAHANTRTRTHTRKHTQRDIQKKGEKFRSVFLVNRRGPPTAPSHIIRALVATTSRGFHRRRLLSAGGLNAHDYRNRCWKIKRHLILYTYIHARIIRECGG